MVPGGRGDDEVVEVAQLGPDALRGVLGHVRGVVPDVDAIAVDEDAVLLTWLRAAGASTVILRPDRVVLLQSTNDDRHLGVDDLDPMVGTPPLATPVP